MTQSDDRIHNFLFEGSNVRGIHVRLVETWQAVLSRNPGPVAVQELLGESLAAATLLGATVKMDGTLTLQTRGDGPVTMLVVQVTGARTVRGMVTLRGEVDGEGFSSLVGDGHLAITIDPGTGGERYQGIVTLEGERLANVLDDYFVNSEQLPTRLWLAADGQRAAGLLLQQLPADDPDAEPDLDAWQHATTLAATLTASELVSLQATTLLRRLFAQDAVRIFDPRSVRFYCRCSRNRVGDMLRAMPREELLETAEEEGGALTVTCDFCNEHYRFDPVDIEALSLPDAPTDGEGLAH